MTEPLIESRAVISDDGCYRFALSRIWDRSKQAAMFVGYNPSTADALVNDRTINRCMDFARGWGYGGLYMGNLFPLRSKDPKAILSWGPATEVLLARSENERWLADLSIRAGIVVAAWGAIKIPADLSVTVARAIGLLGPLHVLRLTKGGHPSHPLYMPGELMPVPWEP